MDIRTNPISVYICDDNQEQIDELCNTLELISKDIAMETRVFALPQDLITELEIMQVKKEKMPEVLFLDIELQEENGIQIGKKVKELTPDICLVFVTAYAEYAVKGYEAKAFRYLLKPVTEEDLLKLFGEMKIEANKMKKLPVKTRSGELQLLLRDIVYISAEDKYSVIYTSAGHYISDVSLADYEMRLANQTFFRIHRKYLLNLYYQKGIENGKILLTNGKSLPISKRRLKPYRSRLFQCMKENLL